MDHKHPPGLLGYAARIPRGSLRLPPQAQVAQPAHGRRAQPSRRPTITKGLDWVTALRLDGLFEQLVQKRLS
jgi:hypothetical protein